jgi:hypothetical protein
VNEETRRERLIERIRALNGARLTGKERFMYETAFAIGDKVEALTEQMKDATRREKIVNYRDWFDEPSAQMSRLSEAVGAAVLNAFARRAASRRAEFEMRHCSLDEDEMRHCALDVE